MKGFTLIELIIVVSIIAILSGIVILVINPAFYQGKARDGRRKTDLAVLQNSLELYYEENGSYPGSGNLAALDPTYISNVPSDPKGGNYNYFSNGTHYEINVALEQDAASMANDGGNNDNLYEVGTDLTISP
jgi:general secretion pathway protein G